MEIFLHNILRELSLLKLVEEKTKGQKTLDQILKIIFQNMLKLIGNSKIIRESTRQDPV